MVGERDAVARGDGLHFVMAVRVEGEQREILQAPRRPCEDLLLPVVLDHHRAALVPGRELHHQRPHHVVGSLGVLVGREELARTVDEHLVELGDERVARRQAQALGDHRELGVQGATPRSGVDFRSGCGRSPTCREPWGRPGSPPPSRTAPGGRPRTACARRRPRPGSAPGRRPRPRPADCPSRTRAPPRTRPRTLPRRARPSPSPASPGGWLIQMCVARGGRRPGRSQAASRLPLPESRTRSLAYHDRVPMELAG